MTGLQKRLVGIQEWVAAAARANERESRDVQILPVSKTHPVSVIQVAMAAGVHEFGENRPQDLAARAQELGADLGRSGLGNTEVLAGLDGVSTWPGIGGRGADSGLAPHKGETKPDMSR